VVIAGALVLGAMLALLACSLPPLVMIPATELSRRFLLTAPFAGLFNLVASTTVHREPDGAPPTIGPDYASTLTRHVFESFTYHAGVGLHVLVQSGRDWHHITEAQYKAVARALRAAVEIDPRVQGVPSTKGVL